MGTTCTLFSYSLIDILTTGLVNTSQKGLTPDGWHPKYTYY